MPRTIARSTPESITPAVPSLPEYLAQFAGPAALADRFEDELMHLDTPASKSYKELRDAFLQQHCRARMLFDAFSRVDDFSMVEEGIRRAGFALGFLSAARMLSAAGTAEGGE